MGEYNKILYDEIKRFQPIRWNNNAIREEINKINQNNNKKVIVLDDDPTGVQTVHNIHVLTKWDLTIIKDAFLDDSPLFFILTNTRGLQIDDVVRVNTEIVQIVVTVAKELGIDFSIISRSDSTLRGYYPLEIDILSKELEKATDLKIDGHFIIPAFFEGGRYTINDIHYVRNNEWLIPAHLTEFAKDKVFGFQHSNLKEWIEEKTNKRILKENCVTLSIDQIHKGVDNLVATLLPIKNNTPIIVNAFSYQDLDILSKAIIEAEKHGKRFLFRTAASFVKSYGGVSDKPLLLKEQVKKANQNGGLIVVGSHVEKTSRQLKKLIEHSNVVDIEVDIYKVLSDPSWYLEAQRHVKHIDAELKNGKDVVVYTSRELITGENNYSNLKISQVVSSALVSIVQGITTKPSYIIAKGGITSSDIATKGLSITKALILGQIYPGIPVWSAINKNTKFLEIPYIVFPGNVGEDNTLLEINTKLK